ncbi:MAG: radical SAM family heme chaperone HemW [Acidobacteria bacterium]|nr:MAG: radical SAM family heme chaperone HemW [Acidobacteriota bacterium]
MLGLYLAVPFCRSKCSYCNFASQVYPVAVYREYCELLAREIELAAAADGLEGAAVDTIYWGGGTPTLLPADGFAGVIAAIQRTFQLAPDCEHTVEAAPGTLNAERLDLLAACGVNRLSLGAQSYHDAELRAVGRLHRAEASDSDITRARATGIRNLNLDLIAGLPHQTAESWRISVERALDTGVPHLSVYMLEVDDDSRLGHELLAGGERYHAHFVPDDDLIADNYEWACDQLTAAGVQQYEISNFARPGFASRHNEGYWLRQPYLGCGLDAHSFIANRRFANPDTLTAYCEPLRAGRLPRTPATALTDAAAREEYYFLGLRRTAGVALREDDPQAAAVPALVASGLLRRTGSNIALTARGRMLSNRVLAEFLEPVVVP